MIGINEYVKLSLEFAYGPDCAALKEKRVAGVQVSESATTRPAITSIAYLNAGHI